MNNVQKQQEEVMTTCQKYTAQGDQKVNELANVCICEGMFPIWRC